MDEAKPESPVKPPPRKPVVRAPGPFEPAMPGIVEWFAANPPKDTDR